MELSRQEYWSGLSRPPPGDLPEPGIKPMFPELQADSLPLRHLGRPDLLFTGCLTSPKLPEHSNPSFPHLSNEI